MTAHEVGLSTASDTALLDYAAADSRVILTHDRKTMPRHASEQIAAGEPMFGVFVIPRRLSLAQVIADLEVMVLCSHYDEWKNIVKFLPL